jgi:hypothetical protein
MAFIFTNYSINRRVFLSATIPFNRLASSMVLKNASNFFEPNFLNIFHCAIDEIDDFKTNVLNSDIYRGGEESESAF